MDPMNDTQPQPSQPSNQGGQPWTNPMDAPPPFPNAAPTGPASYGQAPSYGAPSSNPYRGQPAYQRPSRASGDDRLWAMIAHLSAPIAAVASLGWLTIAGPLIVWLAKKDSSPFARNAAAGAFNFTLSMWLVGLVGWILTFTVIFAVVGIPMIVISALGSIVLGVVGAIKSWNGEPYTYPWQLRVLS